MDETEVAGQSLIEQLQNKTISCTSLTQGDYENIDEYYMSLMMGSGHDAMDQSIVSRYGEAYDTNMHIAMGERFSGCNTNVAFPSGITGFGPMMGGNYIDGNGYNGGYGWGGSFFMGIFGILAIIGLVAVIKWVITFTKK
jgi:hypothetical protein